MPDKRPLRTDDLGALQILSEPQISPDGRWVAYVVTRADLTDDATYSRIWLVPTDGGAPRGFTAPGKHRDWAPRWSPDGRSLAFLSTRSGRPQILVLPAAGGEAYALDTPAPPVSEPIWSPDGQQIAFLSRTFSKAADWVPYPGAPVGDRERAAAQAEGGKAVSDVKVVSRIRFRLDGLGDLGDLRSQVFVVPADGGAPARQVTHGDFDHTSPAWSPDGRHAYCSALRRTDADAHPGTALFAGTDIWRFDVTTGQAERVLAFPGPTWGLAPSPDGRWLAFGAYDNFSMGSVPAQCMMLDLASGQVVSLTAALDRPVGALWETDVRAFDPFPTPQWAADSSGIYQMVADKGEAHLWFFPASGQTGRRLTWQPGRTVAFFDVGPAGEIAFTAGDAATPDELFLQVGDQERRLTGHNDALLAEVDLKRPEPLAYTGADGWPVEGWVLRPAGYEPGRRYPTLLYIHGGPHEAFGAAFNAQLQLLAAAGFAVVCINPRGSGHYGAKFARAVDEDWGGKDMHDLLLGLDKVVGQGLADPDRLGVLGWSYGGYMAAWLITQTHRFRAAIVGAPVINRHTQLGTTDLVGLVEGSPTGSDDELRLLDRSPIRYADQVETPVLVVCGEADLRTPIHQAEQFYTALRRYGKEAYHIRYPNEGHGLRLPSHRRDWYERTVAWFRHRLS